MTNESEIIDAINTLSTSHKQLQLKVAELEAIAGIDKVAIMALFVDRCSEERLEAWNSAVTAMISEHALRVPTQSEEQNLMAKTIVETQRERMKHWTEVFRAAAGKG